MSVSGRELSASRIERIARIARIGEGDEVTYERR